MSTHHDEHSDDEPVGRVLSRREVLALVGLTGAALLAACRPVAQAPAAPVPAAAAGTEDAPLSAACVVRPAQTEGPYFVDGDLNRPDIRTDPAGGEAKLGIPLTLEIAVADLAGGACAPLAGALVDIWHCDAEGVYSGVADPSRNTRGQLWLRGQQVTGADGLVRFTTIYPGWYPGRAVHIHFKVRTAAPTATEFTSQLYFDEGVNAEVFAQPPYAQRGPANTPNARDRIFQQGGDQLLVTPTRAGEGYSARFDLALDLSA
jgi:protocatechuate 3,4-dioxygenase beta subunit